MYLLLTFKKWRIIKNKNAWKSRINGSTRSFLNFFEKTRQLINKFRKAFLILCIFFFFILLNSYNKYVRKKKKWTFVTYERHCTVFIFMSFRFSFILFGKQERGARKLDPLTIPILAIIELLHIHVDTHTYDVLHRDASVLFFFLPIHFRIKLSQFSAPSHLRTHVNPPWQHASLPLAFIQHRKHTSTHVPHSCTMCCQTVRDRSRRGNVTITPNRYLCDTHSCRKYPPAGEKRGSVGKDRSTRISLFARITI